MYRAKVSGRGSYALFEPALHIHYGSRIEVEAFYDEEPIGKLTHQVRATPTRDPFPNMPRLRDVDWDRDIHPVLQRELGGARFRGRRDGHREALRGHTVVHLQIGTDEAWRRASGKGRPLARDRNRFDQLKQDREAVYESLASAWLPPMPRDGVRRAVPALEALESAPAGTRLAWASTASGDYPVFFGRGLLNSGFFHPEDGRRFVVIDENVASLSPVAGDAQLAVPPGTSVKESPRSRLP